MFEENKAAPAKRVNKRDEAAKGFFNVQVIGADGQPYSVGGIPLVESNPVHRGIIAAQAAQAETDGTLKDFSAIATVNILVDQKDQVVPQF